MPQTHLFDEAPTTSPKPFKTQLLKWIGNKQRFAHEIIAQFPSDYGRYFEPFIGSGAVLGTLSPADAVASDACKPLVDLWRSARDTPDRSLKAYAERWEAYQKDPQGAYDQVKARFNESPNGDDLLFLCRSCYGGVIRFRKSDGHMSTPRGPHKPVNPESFANRLRLWTERIAGTDFQHCDFEGAFEQAKSGDLIYCDPPYVDSQAILYGAQAFTLSRLYEAITKAKQRGVHIALSIDGSKKSGKKNCDVSIPEGLFEEERSVNCGRSMLRRFQMGGQTLERELVSDRLLTTW